MSVSLASGSWTKVGLSGWDYINPNSMAIGSDGVIYYGAEKTVLGSINPEYSLFKSVNNGQDWISLQNTLPAIGRIDAVDIDPLDSSVVYISIVTTLGGGGIYKSEDGGLTWIKKISGIHFRDVTINKHDPAIVYALEATLSSNAGFYKSTDYGETWQRYSNGISIYPIHFRSVIVDPVEPNILYITASLQPNGTFGLHKSLNGGQNWTQINEGFNLDQGGFWSLAIDSQDNSNLYLSASVNTQNGFELVPGVYKSTDAGITWNRVSEEYPLFGVFDLQVHQSSPNILVASTQSSEVVVDTSPCGVMMSRDSGESWVIVNEGLSLNERRFCTGTLRINSAENYILLGTSDGIWKREIDPSTPPTPTPTQTPTPTFTPTPTPEPCVLTHFPDPILQTDDRWDEIGYGGTYHTFPSGARKLAPFRYNQKTNGGTDTIADWGCNLTSHAMNINYYANLQNVKNQDGTTFQTDPQILNEWLQQEPGGYFVGKILGDENNPYVMQSLVNSEAVVRYAKKKGVTLSYEPLVAYKPRNETGAEFTQSQSSTVNTAMCELRPGLLKVQFPGTSSPGHFVVTSGIATVSRTPSWRIHDPLGEQSPINLSPKYSNTFYQYQLAKEEFPAEYLSIALHSPAELVITAPDGKKTGLNPMTNTEYVDIPDSTYGLDTLSTSDGDFIEQKLFTVYNPLIGNYDVQVFGIGQGKYSLELTYSKGDDIVKLPLITSETTPGAVDLFQLNFVPASDASIARDVEIDVPTISGSFIAIASSNRKVPIIIQSTSTFNAARIDRSSISGGIINASIVHAEIEDSNEDGIEDLTLYFTLKELGIVRENSEVCVKGYDEWGNMFKGCDAVEITSMN